MSQELQSIYSLGASFFDTSCENKPETIKKKVRRGKLLNIYYIPLIKKVTFMSPDLGMNSKGQSQSRLSQQYGMIELLIPSFSGLFFGVDK